jgi:hypothetical protein
MNPLESALQRALSVRLNLQISLSQLSIIDEWMDIHLDRWLEHIPTPADMPDGADAPQYLAMLGSDLRRVWWGAYGDPRGFVPRMADYFKLCNIAKSDAHILDQLGEVFEPEVVGSWIGVWGGKVITGWHFIGPQPWDKVETMFGTHEAKYQLKGWVEQHGVARIERFTQSIGEEPYSEIELAVPGADVGAKVDALSNAFATLTGAPLPDAMLAQLRASTIPAFGLGCRIRGGKIARLAAIAPAASYADAAGMAAAAETPVDPKLQKLVGAMAQDVARVEYGRAGERAGVDIYMIPSDGPPGKQQPTPPAPPPSSAPN